MTIQTPEHRYYNFAELLSMLLPPQLKEAQIQVCRSLPCQQFDRNVIGSEVTIKMQSDYEELPTKKPTEHQRKHIISNLQCFWNHFLSLYQVYAGKFKFTSALDFEVAPPADCECIASDPLLK
jgi:hypothetical protein